MKDNFAVSSKSEELQNNEANTVKPMGEYYCTQS